MRHMQLLASIGDIVSCLYLVGICSSFYGLKTQLPIVIGHSAGGQHVARADRVCAHCGAVAVADEVHIIFECPALCTVRQQYTHICIFVSDGQRHHEVLFCILCTIFYICY